MCVLEAVSVFDREGLEPTYERKRQDAVKERAVEGLQDGFMDTECVQFPEEILTLVCFLNDGFCIFPQTSVCCRRWFPGNCIGPQCPLLLHVGPLGLAWKHFTMYCLQSSQWERFTCSK